MKRLIPVLGLGVLMLAAGAPAVAEVTIEDYVRIQRRQLNVPPDYIKTYVEGVHEALLTFNDLAASNGLEVLCLPEGQEPMNADAFKYRIDQLINEARRERPDFETYAQQANISVVGLFVLNEEYPCKPGASEGDEGSADPN